MSEYGFDEHVVNVPLTQQEQQQSQQQDKYKHPICLFFHFLFKVTALVLYFLHPGSFIMSFILCILCIAFDFYTVKNITGRILVGMRWWNDVQEDGSNVWVFESASDQKAVQQAEALVFWISIFVTPVIWGLFVISSIFGIVMFSFDKLMWLPIPIAGLALSGANAYGYQKCASDQKTKLKGMAQSYAQNYLAQSIMNRTSAFFG